MKHLRKLAAFLVAAAMPAAMASASFAVTEDGTGGGVEPTDQLVYLAHLAPTSLELYKDSERTELIEKTADIPVGEKVYYTLESDEGYRITKFNAPADYINTDYFIMSEVSTSFVFENTFMGDFDGNRRVNLTDVVCLIQYLAHFDKSPKWKDITVDCVAGDYDRNGSLDLKDVVMMLRVLAGADECPYGGVQTEFDATCDVAYELGEKIATIARGEHCNKATVLTSAEEFAAFVGAMDNDFPPYEASSGMPQDFIDGQNQVIAWLKENCPLDKDALCAKYSEEFFEKYDVIVATAFSHYFPETTFTDFSMVNGKYDAEFYSPASGVVQDPDYDFNQLIIVEKGALAEGIETEVSVHSGYMHC